MGGGDGVTVAHLLERYPALTVTVFDLPSVAGLAEAALRDRFGARIRIHAGDLFADDVPAGPDAVLFSHVLEIFSGDEISSLLAKAYRLLPRGGKVFIYGYHVSDNETEGVYSARPSLYLNVPASGQGMAYPARDYREVRRLSIRVAAVQSWVSAMRVLLPGLLTTAIVWLGAVFVAAGELSGGLLVAFYGFAVFLAEQLRRATTMVDQLTRGVGRRLTARPGYIATPSWTDHRPPRAPAVPYRRPRCAGGSPLRARRRCRDRGLVGAEGGDDVCAARPRPARRVACAAYRQR